MKTDRELLELAAKAAGIYLEWDGHPAQWQAMYYEGKTYHSWNPLTDDDDALRLAVKLRLDLMFFIGFGEVHSAHCMMEGDNKIEPLGKDDYAATRRAIVRAAAAIGESMND